jgi:hypothetical protein
MPLDCIVVVGVTNNGEVIGVLKYLLRFLSISKCEHDWSEK